MSAGVGTASLHSQAYTLCSRDLHRAEFWCRGPGTPLGGAKFVVCVCGTQGGTHELCSIQPFILDPSFGGKLL